MLQVKRKTEGTIDKDKARLAAVGNQQSQDTFDAIKRPTARSATVKLLIRIHSLLDHHLPS